MKMSLVTDSWIMLTFAIMFGVLGTISLKLSHGFEKLTPVFLLAIFYSISFILLTFAIKYIDLSVVYAVWSGLGTILVTIISIAFFSESVSVKKIIFLLLIIIGILGINQ